jgi:hypothetical protein
MFRAKYITSETRAIYEIITKNTARPDGMSTMEEKKKCDLHAG